MAGKIKKYLLNRKSVLIVISLFVIFCLLLPFQKARADMFGIVDAIKSIGDQIEELSGPLMGSIIKVFFTYIVGLVLLYTSANLLDLAIKQSPNWLVIQNSAMVRSGWNFTLGITNLVLILIFVVIAIAYILKIESFQAKKSLVRLIVVALLLNFSLAFIGALVDISNVFYNTVLKGNENAVTGFIEILGGGGKDVIMNLVTWIIALAVAWIIPLAGGIAQFIFAMIVLPVAFFPNIMTWTFQIISFFTVSTLFFTYTFLFAARVFIIQILAILSPFAFLCLILPQTKKYWDEWLQHLIQWTFLGIVLLFFLSIGIKTANELIPPGGLTPVFILGWGQIASYFVYYFFIFIYLIIILFVSKKFMPAFADFIISQATSMAQMGYQRVLKPLAEGARKQADKGLEKSKKYQAFREKLERNPMIGKLVGGRGVYAAKKAGDVDKAENIFEKRFGAKGERLPDDKKDINGIYSAYSNPQEKVAFASYLRKAKGIKGIEKLDDKILTDATKLAADIDPSKVGDIIEPQMDHLQKLADTNKDKNLKNILDSYAIGKNRDKKEVVEELATSGVEVRGAKGVSVSRLWQGNESQRELVLKEAERKKAMQNLKTEDFENMSREKANSDEFLEDFVKYCRSRDAARKMLEKGILDWNRVVETVKRLGGEQQIAKTNLPLLALPDTQGGRALGLSPLENPDLSPITRDSATKKASAMKIQPAERENILKVVSDNWDKPPITPSQTAPGAGGGAGGRQSGGGGGMGRQSGGGSSRSSGGNP